MQCPHCHLESEVPRAYWGRPVVCPNCSGQFIVSADAFDPYYTWLGIPPAQQPPNLYRLLGLQLFEPNLDVIENAADRQMAHVRSYQLGAHAVESQRLLNEIASARVTLLSVGQRQLYDEQLHRMLGPAMAAPHYHSAHAPALAAVGSMHGSCYSASMMPAAPEPPPAPPQPTVGFAPAIADSAIRRRPQRNYRRTQTGGLFSTICIILGGIAGLALGVLIIFYITGQDYLGLSARLRKKLDQGQETPTPRPEISKSTSRPDMTPSARPVDPRTSQFDSKAETMSGAPTVVGPTVAVPAVAAPSVAPFPRAVNLPDPSMLEPLVVARLPGDAADPVEFKLYSGFAALATGGQFNAQTNVESGDFTISYLPPTDFGQARVALAALRREGSDLVFRWLQSQPDAAVRRQVRNCVVEIITGGQSRKLQLRQPLEAPKLQLELDDDHQILEIDVGELPKLSRLRLVFKDLQNVGGGKLRGGATLCEFSKSVFVDFEQMKEAQIEIQLLQQPRTKTLLVRLEPVFRESANRRFELSLRGVEKVKRAQEKVLSDAQSARAQAQTLLTNAQAALQRLQANPPAPSQRPAWETQVAAAQVVISAAPRTFERLDAQIAEAQGRLAAVPKVLGFVSSLHQKASIEYAITAVDGNNELILVGGNGP